MKVKLVVAVWDKDLKSYFLSQEMENLSKLQSITRKLQRRKLYFVVDYNYLYRTITIRVVLDIYKISKYYTK
jgi:hypothetical protein